MKAPEDDGFTLIELLTVILIIGVLAAIAIPTFMSQRGRAYRSAMASDLHALITSETAWSISNSTFTADTTDLQSEGYRQSKDVTAHVKVLGPTYLACTKHAGSSEWLVFDSATSATSTSNADCA